MNPGSGFGSGFGSQNSSSSPFGGSPSFSSTTSSQVFGSGSGMFQAASNTGGFGSTPSASTGTFGASFMQGSAGFGQSSSGVFGISGSNSSGFGSGSTAQGFGSSASGSTPAFGTGQVNTTGFGTGGLTGPSPRGPPPAYGTATGTGSSSSGGMVIGGGFGQASTVGSSVFGATSKATMSASQIPGFGFGTRSSVSGFGTGSVSTPGFGSGSTGMSGFGTGSSGTSGFGSGLTSTSGFGIKSTTASGFGTGVTSTSAFGGGSVGTSGFSTGSSSSSGFGTGLSSTSGFSASGGVFGTSATASNASFSSPVSQNSSVFGGASVFGTKGERGSDQVGHKSTAATFRQSQTQSPFGSHTNTAQGLSGAGSSVFGQLSTASTTASVFGGSVSTGRPSITSGFGSIAATSPAGSTSSSAAASSMFGGSGTAKGTSQKVTPLTGGSVGAAGSGFPASGSTFGVSSVFGASSKTSEQGVPSIFGGASKSSQQDNSSSRKFGEDSSSKTSQQQQSSSMFSSTSQQGSVFGGAAKTTEDATRPSEKKRGSMLFPAAMSIPSVGGSGQAASVQGLGFQSGTSSSVFGGKTAFGDATTGQAGSVFGGKSTFRKTEQSGSVFGGRHGSDANQAGSSAPAVFKAEKDKESTQKKTEADGSGFKGEELASGPGGSSPKTLKRGRLVRIAEPTGGSSGGLFGKNKECGSVNMGAASSVFDLKNSSGHGTFHLPTSPDKTQRTRKQINEEARDGHNQPTASSGPSPSKTPEKIRLRRSSSVLEDISSKTWLSLKGVPTTLNRGSILRNHFKQFGKVKQVRCVPAKRQASIQFETHDAAAQAKQHGAVLSSSEKPMTIFWKASPADKSPSAAEEGKSLTGSTKKSSPPQGESSSLSKYSNVPSSVLSELDSMGGGESETRRKLESGARDKPMGFLRRRPHEQARSETDLISLSRKKTPPPAAPSGSGSSSAVSSVKGDVVTVSGLRKMIATTTMEKVKVLDARDKLIRQMLGRQTTGIDSKAFVGTCPDMCPEKERIYREEVRRLSIYEIIPGSSTLTGSTSLVDQYKAVKEYSRSSADQDEPLPYELRPLPVLTMTMNYLLVEIAGRGEDNNWAEWYDFLWNRTRSIRKEITQQQLLSLEVVELMEKCVRFHVYCSERLCMEDMMVFDPKINNENLTKCLQTLKELYADMENKHSMFCPNEAEFRAYMVLMNLNEGDTLREVQQLRPEVRESPEVTFAVKMYSALNSNNYVRFFRLVTTASFLNGCILHRYFNQIRARGLQIIVRAHTAGVKTVPFPLSEFVRLLAFENETDAKEFCAYYGLQAQGSELILDRSALVEPETSIPSWRAISLVESKRMVSVGEVINGASLQPVQLPEPQCSFDKQGRFIGNLEGLTDVAGSEDKVKPFSVKHSFKPQMLLPSPLEQFDDAPAATSAEASTAVLQGQAAVARQQQLHASVRNEFVKMIARELFWEVIDESANAISESCVDFCKRAVVLSGDIINDIISSVTSDIARDLSSEVIEAETEHQQQVATAEKQEREKRVVADLLTSVIETTVDIELRQLAQAEIETARAQAEKERQQRCVTSLGQDMLEGVMTELVLEVCDEVHQVDVIARLQLLSDLQKAVELKRISQWFSFWRKALVVRTKQKRAMLHFPCAPPMQSAGQRLRELFPDRPQHLSSLVPGKPSLLLNDRAHMTLLSPLEAEQRSLTLTAHLSLASLLKNLQRAGAWQPLKLGSILRAPLLHSIQAWPEELLKNLLATSLQWKMLLSLPGSIEMEEDDDNSDEDMTMEKAPKHGNVLHVLCQWLCAKFTRGEGSLPAGDGTAVSKESSSKKHVLSQYSVELACVPGTTTKLRLGVCVRQVPEFSSSTKKDKPLSAEQGQAVTKGTSGVMFLLPHADTADDTKWLASRLRLARLLEAKPMLPPTPLVLLLPFTVHTSSPTSLSGPVTREVTQRLGVPGFQEQGLVSSVAVVELPVKTGLPPDVAVTSQILQKQVADAVKFLASNAPEPPDLCRQRLGDLLEDMLTQHFFTPVLQDLRLRQHHGKLHQAPNSMIGLYNSILDHIAMALTSPALQDISWPVPELQHAEAAGSDVPHSDWNSKKHLADIYEVVANLRLPWFQYKDQSASDWGQVCRDVWTFVSGVVKKRCDSSVSLTTRISHILARTCLQFENMCSLTQNEDLCSPTYINAPWTDIISACVDFRLKRLHNWKDGEEEVGGDLEVFYEEEDMDGFEPPASWIQAMLDSEDTESNQIEDTLEVAAKLHFAKKTYTENCEFSTNNSSIDQETERDENTIDSDVNTTTYSQSSNKTLLEAAQDFSELSDSMRLALETSDKLLLHVGEERCKAQAFEKYLESVLQGQASLTDSFFHDPTRLHIPQVIQTPSLLQITPINSESGPRQAASSCHSSRDPLVLLQTAGHTPRRLPVSSRKYSRRLLQDMCEGTSNEGDDDEGVSEAKRLCREGQHPLISEGLNQLKEELRAQRQASELYEKRLQSLLNS